MKTKLTIHKIAQVDRVCSPAGLPSVHPATGRGCIRKFHAYGYLAAWRFLVANKAHQS